MTTPTDANEIVAAAGGEIVGKTRLQKSAYFLEVGGVGFGFDFSYHYYGPYSEELATATDDAIALGTITAEWQTSQSGFRYATYKTAYPSSEPGGHRSAERRREIFAILDSYDAVSLELAATAHFLAANGFDHDPWTETRKRKAGKATDERIDKATRLLDQLGFAVDATEQRHTG